MGIDIVADFRPYSARHPEAFARRARLEAAYEKAAGIEHVAWWSNIDRDDDPTEKLIRIMEGLSQITTGEDVEVINCFGVGFKDRDHQSVSNAFLEVASIDPERQTLTFRNSVGRRSELIGDGLLRTVRLDELDYLSFYGGKK